MICKILTKQIETHPHYWDRHFNVALWAYKTSFQTTLGITPFHLVYSQEALLSIDLEMESLRVIEKNGLKPRDKVKERLLQLTLLQNDPKESREYYKLKVARQRDRFNKQLASKDIKENQLVLRYNNKCEHNKGGKFDLRQEGPFQILQKLDNGSYQLQSVDGRLHHTRINGWRLKPIFSQARMLQQEEFQSQVESDD